MERDERQCLCGEDQGQASILCTDSIPETELIRDIGSKLYPNPSLTGPPPRQELRVWSHIIPEGVRV